MINLKAISKEDFSAPVAPGAGYWAMVRNYAAIKLSVAITVISRGAQGPGIRCQAVPKFPSTRLNGEGALDPRNGGTLAAKLRQVKSGKPRHLVFTQERRVPN